MEIKQQETSQPNEQTNCSHEDNITYLDLIQIDGCPQYIVKCKTCGKIGVIYLVEGEEDWNTFNDTEYMSEMNKIKERIINEIAITKEMQNSGGGWTSDYKEGFIDGLKRAIELFNPNN